MSFRLLIKPVSLEQRLLMDATSMIVTMTLT